MRKMLVVGFGLLVTLVSLGCDKGGDGAAPAGSGAAASGSRTSLTEQQIEEAYKLCDADKIDKSMSAVTAKLGAPQKTEGDSSIWYGVGKDKSSCVRLVISKKKGIESGTTDKTSCGLK